MAKKKCRRRALIIVDDIFSVGPSVTKPLKGKYSVLKKMCGQHLEPDWDAVWLWRDPDRHGHFIVKVQIILYIDLNAAIYC